VAGLNASLATALSGLTADQGALEATANNVSNINTPGYSREVPVLETSEPVVVGRLTLGTGVTLKTIESVRDPILESRIQQETQNQGQYSAMVDALQQLQVSFGGSSGDIGSAMSGFFDSINQLSTSPADLSLRQGVLTAAGNLASAFNVTAERLNAQRTNLDASVEQTVGQINQLTRQIAQLNGQITNLESVGENAGTFLDQRTQVIDQLSSLVDVSVIPSDNTITVTTAAGTALVAGQRSFQLSTAPDASGLQRIDSQGSDVTGSIVSGQLGGLLQIRDQQIPGVLKQLDTLASSLANGVNGVQTTGYDLNGNATTGVNLFTPPPSGGTGAAASLSVAITDPAQIAASGDGTAGDNGNAEALYKLRNQSCVQGETPSGYYSNIVFQVGNAASNAQAEQSASNLVLQQLNDQRSSISGVSLDEEAANLVRYQQAYAASAQIISAINSMMQTVINMKSS
jgi:flagellar hook-associated protein 1 FlgK